MNGVVWYTARSAGIVAYLLLTSSVVLGLLLSTRAKLSWPRFAVQDVHRFLSQLTAIFIVIHGGALLLDQVVPFSLRQELVPFTSSYRPFAVALGIVSAAAWAIGAQLLFPDSTARLLATAAWVVFVAYAYVVIFVTDAFLAAIVNYLPSTLFLIVAFYGVYRAHPNRQLLAGLVGLVLTLVAAAVQQSHVALHPRFNHNALYHLLQGIALLLIFDAARFLTER